MLSLALRPMTEFVQSPAFQVYVVCASILILQSMLLALLTAATRSRRGDVINPEDTRLNPNGKVVGVGGDDPTVARLARAHRNTLENVPLFLAAGLMFAMTGPDRTTALGLLGGYTALRLLYTLCYLRARQPWRTACFAASIFTLATIVILTLVVVLVPPC